jgi:LacI family transcriptional regulator
VTNDDETAAFKIVEYFVSQGRRNIVYLGPEVIKFLAHSRYQGYHNALSHFGIQYHPEYVVSCKLSREDLEEKIYQFVQSDREFDAVLCTGGLDAYVAGRAILGAKLSIPDDVMLAEFGNNNIVHRLGVPFISIDQFPYEMGQNAVELIVQIIENGRESLVNDHILIDTKLLFHHNNQQI